MLKFNVCLNQGNEDLNTGKSITANEVCETAARSKPSSRGRPTTTCPWTTIMIFLKRMMKYRIN